ncbi:hypothetical protein [Streptomyces sp. NPDC015242]|uniref:hypothetical protein n=1 Tax=Streptomyces sp. NPDC015242 TaxID=3364951 RepID=UPI0036FFA8E2
MPSTALALAGCSAVDTVLTVAGVTEQLGVHRDTAQAALTAPRAQRRVDVMEQQGVDAAQAAAALGYPAGLTRSAGTRAQAIMGGRRARPCLAAVARSAVSRPTGCCCGVPRAALRWARPGHRFTGLALSAAGSLDGRLDSETVNACWTWQGPSACGAEGG